MTYDLFRTLLLYFSTLVDVWLIQKVLDLHSLYHLQCDFVHYPEATMSRKQLRMTTKSYKYNKLINCPSTHWNYWTMTSTFLNTIHRSNYSHLIVDNSKWKLSIFPTKSINSLCHQHTIRSGHRLRWLCSIT